MKVLKVVEPGRFEFEERSIPEPRHDEALLQMCYCGICGSDVRVFTGNHPYANYPRIMGHEISARLIRIGDYAYDSKPLVSVNPYFTCGFCEACRKGKSNCCLKNQTMGVQRDGAYAEYIIVPKEKIINAISSSDSQMLALTEPFSVALHAVERGDIQLGDKILIFGAGPIGVFCGVCAINKGAEVSIVDPHPLKMEIAYSLGLKYVSWDNNDICIDASGSKQAIFNCFSFVRPGGKVILIGHSKEEILMPHADIIKKELSIFASRNSPHFQFPQNIQKTITHIVPFMEVPGFFKKLAAKDGTVLKALIKF